MTITDEPAQHLAELTEQREHLVRGGCGCNGEYICHGCGRDITQCLLKEVDGEILALTPAPPSLSAKAIALIDARLSSLPVDRNLLTTAEHTDVLLDLRQIFVDGG